MRLLAVLFAPGEPELTVTEAASLAEVPVATASREIARLVEHGTLRSRRRGRQRLVQANWSLSWASDLRSVLTKTAGTVGLLEQALRGVDGIEQAAVFGSWAARLDGEAGPFPRDLDLLIVGHPDRMQLSGAVATVEAASSVDVNPLVLTASEWEGDEPFVIEIRSRPLCALGQREPEAHTQVETD